MALSNSEKSRLFRVRNPTYHHDRYVADKVRHISRMSVYQKSHPEKMSKGRRTYLSKDPRRRLLACSRQSAKLKGLEHSLVLEDIQTPEVCPALGILLDYSIGVRVKKGKPLPNGKATLDRIDNSRGYVPGNVITISWRANLLKRDASMEELRKLVDFYAKVIS